MARRKINAWRQLVKMHCDLHGNYEAESIEIFGHILYSACPLCTAEQEKIEQIAAKEQEMLRQRADYINRGIEPEFFNANLNKYRPENETEEKALNACKSLLVGRCNKVLLLGQNGVGKTMLACSLALILNGKRTTMYEISSRIRAGYNNGENELDILNSLLKYPFLAIDELGRTKGSEAELNWLSYLIDKAHTRGIKLLLISNKQRACELPRERKGEAIEFYLPNDAISRLQQNSIIVEVKGRDRRATTTMAAV